MSNYQLIQIVEVDNTIKGRVWRNCLAQKGIVWRRLKLNSAIISSLPTQENMSIGNIVSRHSSIFELEFFAWNRNLTVI